MINPFFKNKGPFKIDKLLKLSDIENTNKFKKHYPNWKQKYNTKKIIEELIEYQK